MLGSQGLTVVHKWQHMEAATQLIRRYEEDPSILERIVTGDETWVHHYDPESKRQSMEWKHPSSPAQKKFKRQPSTKKVMLTLFWDMHGPILVHSQAHGQTVNSVNYCAMLRNELKPAICKKRRGMLSKKVLLHHDNARPHTAAATVETVQQLGSEFLQHPPYSLDLAPSNYHIFSPLKEVLCGRRFTSDEEVKEAVHTWLQEQPRNFSAGIQKLVERYNKCIVLQGDYVEKWYVKLLTVTSIKAVICILPLLFDSRSYISILCRSSHMQEWRLFQEMKFPSPTQITVTERNILSHWL